MLQNTADGAPAAIAIPLACTGRCAANPSAPCPHRTHGRSHVCKKTLL